MDPITDSKNTFLSVWRTHTFKHFTLSKDQLTYCNSAQLEVSATLNLCTDLLKNLCNAL